jgi:hypothetical protein
MTDLKRWLERQIADAREIIEIRRQRLECSQMWYWTGYLEAMEKVQNTIDDKEGQ